MRSETRPSTSKVKKGGPGSRLVKCFAHVYKAEHASSMGVLEEARGGKASCLVAKWRRGDDRLPA